ncbi:hypothetical protein KIW84_050201 [Lathyrus oleraceus]|uniref:Uncharacterized protein n=1 Tax=Pisum sativum TaxID=3888 RepID=A0A9D5AC45_PEA|nr:hypothetical protein KIW84_050201 [Pisum sativum]
MDGLFEEYNPFVMQMYGNHVSLTLCDVEALLYVQEAPLDKFCQELAATTIATNIAHISHEVISYRGVFSGNNGRGNRYNQGRGRGGARPLTGGSTSMSQEKSQDSSQNSQVMAMMASTGRPLATTQEYSLPAELES